jgi:DNA end-binding protein Ku
VPVQAFNMVGDGERGEVHLNQLHAECHSRIRYKKVCPIHGEVTNDEIVSGYETGDDQYVVIDSAELDKLRPEADKSVRIETFVQPNQIDPAYFTGQHYFLVPDGAPAAGPYSVLLEAMQDKERIAIGQATLFNRERLFVIRPLNGLLALSTLYYADQVRQADQFTGNFTMPQTKKEEVKLAQTLINASTSNKVKLDQFQDLYLTRLHELIDAKVQGREIVAPPEEDEAPVINLMDALKASVAKTAGRGKAAATATSAAKPKRKLAASHRGPLKKKQRKVS